jgi:arsenical pump membrane protein
MDRRLAGVLLLPLALLIDEPHARVALEQTWPPFALVTGLLLIGRVAGGDGVFDDAAARLERLRVRPITLLLACYALIAGVTALLNLDTAVVFLTPVLIRVSRQRGVDPAPFLYGSVFMANASSLFLPGSNLTNLLVLSGESVSGVQFFQRMLPMALAAALLTAAGLVIIHRRVLRAAGGAEVAIERAPIRRSAGFWGVLLAAVLILVLRDAALPVLALGLALLAWRSRGAARTWREGISALGLPVLLSLLGLSVALGTLARASTLPAHTLAGAGAPATAVLAAVASVLVNNLPAAVLLSSARPAHTEALLLGLNIGPNLAVTGSLAVLLWWRAAVASGLRPSALAYTRQGLLLTPLALIAALAVGAG